MRSLILGVGLSVGIAMVFAHQARPPVPPRLTVDQPRVAAEFDARVKAYVSLHRRLEGTVPTIAVSTNYAEVLSAIDALGAKIRAERREARRGDVFTPEVECWFREMIDASLQGCDTKAIYDAINEENPPNVTLALQINARWPNGASRGPMPPQLLADLPQLPDDLQYRFIDRDLVLWDAHANLVVDFIRKALP